MKVWFVGRSVGRGARRVDPASTLLKLVYLNPTGALGGAEMCLVDLLASLRACRPSWPLRVLLGDDGPLRRAVDDLGVSCDVVPLPERLARVGDAGLALRGQGRLGLATRGPGAGLAAAGYLSKLRARLRAERPDLVQTNGMKAHVLGAWATPRRVPVVWHLHDYAGPRPVMARLLRWSARRGVRAVAVSRSVADDAAAVLGPGVPVQPIDNAVDLDRFSPGEGDGPALDASAGLPTAPPGTVRVGLVATYARWKGHAAFLEAASKVPADRPVRFFVVGGPIYRSAGSQHDRGELEALAGALGLAGRVGFVGQRADPEAVFRALDVVAHASTKPEPFGRVIVEAMACGRALVASQTGGAAELFADGVDALGCPPSDPDCLAGAIVRLVDDPGLRRRLGEAGRASAVARFDRRGLGELWARVYEDAGRDSR